MTEIFGRMLNDDDSPAKCRERRRRRIEMRRLSTNPLGNSPQHPTVPPPSPLPIQTCSHGAPGLKRIRMAAETGESSRSTASASASSGDDMGALSSETAVAEPVVGSMSVAGRSREMEDAITIRTSLCSPEINRGRQVHFFGVYDGHGGPHVAALCRERMHVLLEEELMKQRVECTRNEVLDAEELELQMWRRAMKRSFARMDEMAFNTCACGSAGFRCACQVALGGSTAVVALLTQEHIIVANCGDSRAVLCRGRKAIPLSVDHKPDRPDELSRINAAGGRVVISMNGARVGGILAMSRAIGDKFLKPAVISDPEISFTKRDAEDECLILASDGLWDVLSNDLACEVARECLREGNSNGDAVDGEPQGEEEGTEALYSSRSMLAAALLTRLALGRRSLDNISVMLLI